MELLGCANIAREKSRAIKMPPNLLIHVIGSKSLEKVMTFVYVNKLSTIMRF
jgi:hypothetical protein